PSRRTDIKSPQIAANQLNHISRILQQSLKGGEGSRIPLGSVRSYRWLSLLSMFECVEFPCRTLA
ncbi:hypothetical protein, partial [Rhizobium sp. RU36D]|uniref:hypothetical protein n=1 Tax=Rhizobium sp. RU36D TaxID=1907415 RepID=UPI001AECD349